MRLSLIEWLLPWPARSDRRKEVREALAVAGESAQHAEETARVTGELQAISDDPPTVVTIARNLADCPPIRPRLRAARPDGSTYQLWRSS